MIFRQLPAFSAEFQLRLDQSFLMDEAQCLEKLAESLSTQDDGWLSIQRKAADLVNTVRAHKNEQSHMQMLMHEYSLASEEGVVLMCLAEALLRIPDNYTADQLIQGKLSAANWERHLGNGRSLFINASSWGLMLSGKMFKPTLESSRLFIKTFDNLVVRLGEPVIRTVLRRLMKLLGKQFVMGVDIQQALNNSKQSSSNLLRYSFDMLGEAAITAADAERYFQAYKDAIEKIGADNSIQDVYSTNSISVKLSALHPRYDLNHYDDVMEKLGDKLLELARLAAQKQIALTVDAEEADRLELSLAIFERVFRDESLADWQGLGLALQAYQRRAFDVIDLLADMSQRIGKRIPLRLVKGAYWDAEIKRAQERGLDSYPVFTRKENTDVSYLACVRKLIEHRQHFYPQLATHNAFTVCAILQMMDGSGDFEFQRLHGMGEQMYQQVIAQHGCHCRVYAPVGRHEDLLPYLVRRLLENGANSSFVNMIEDEQVPVSRVVENPLELWSKNKTKPNPRIPTPLDLYGASRRNSSGMNFASLELLRRMQQTFQDLQSKAFGDVMPIVDGQTLGGSNKSRIHSPIDGKEMGQVCLAEQPQLTAALDSAHGSFARWQSTRVEARADCLLGIAELLERHREELIYLCVHEAGRSVTDALAEVREAADFCRYYARLGIEQMAQPVVLPGPTGESNQLYLHGRGVFVCISPWNFPIAIFVGQIVAALMAGNCVLAKPATNTTRVAFRCIELMHQSGIPNNVLHFLPVSGALLDEVLLRDPRITGVAFTGSTETAYRINQSLVVRRGPIATFIGETGGQNVMIADSSALPEQLVNDSVYSAFNSAGQRCSALRVLYVQEDIADHVISLIKGSMAELRVGDPAYLETDVGPVIDQAALSVLETHVQNMQTQGRVLYQTAGEHIQGGNYLSPTLIALDSIDQLEQEFFGPILHVVRYKAEEIDKVVDEINNTGYGLTFGIHSRVDQNIVYLSERVRAGNIYVNRNMIGAVVGVQPFGGMGLSGTGPKAGGPHYLQRFCTERTLTINTAAVGGNAQLLSESD